jgi:hypothetical protein
MGTHMGTGTRIQHDDVSATNTSVLNKECARHMSAANISGHDMDNQYSEHSERLIYTSSGRDMMSATKSDEYTYDTLIYMSRANAICANNMSATNMDDT